MIIYRIESKDGWGVFARQSKQEGIAYCGNCARPHRYLPGVRYGTMSMRALRRWFGQQWTKIVADPELMLTVYECPEEHVQSHDDIIESDASGRLLVGIAESIFKPEYARKIFSEPLLQAMKREGLDSADHNDSIIEYKGETFEW